MFLDKKHGILAFILTHKAVNYSPIRQREGTGFARNILEFLATPNNAPELVRAFLKLCVKAWGQINVPFANNGLGPLRPAFRNAESTGSVGGLYKVSGTPTAHPLPGFTSGGPVYPHN